MNDQMRPRPYQLWRQPAPAPAAMEPVVFAGAGGKPARQAWKRKPAAAGGKPTRQGWKRRPAAAAAPRVGAAAPRNTTSYLIRAKRAGGVASLVSPCPVTPAILPTPQLSPSREVLVEMAREAWGVDGYGSMKGLIRLRSPTAAPGGGGGGDSCSGESDVEEHVEVERRLDHDLSRFEMLQLPRVATDGEEDEEDEARMERLEEENLTLRERLFFMERDMAELRRRLLAVETLCHDRNGCGGEPDGSAEEEVLCGSVVGDGDIGEDADTAAAMRE